MKIVFINNYLHEYYIGGAEESSRILIKELSKSNRVYTISFYKDNIIIKEKKVINIFLKRNRFQDLRYATHFFNQLNISLAFKVKSIIDRIAPDIVHFNNIQGYPAILIRFLDQYKIVHTLRDYNTICFRNSLYKNGICDQCNLCKLQSVYKKSLYANIDGIVSNSNLTLSLHNQYGYKRGQQSIIYAGYDMPSIKIHKNSLTDIRFGYLGKINKAKGCHLLNEIGRQILEATGNKLLVAGTGNQSIIDSFDKKSIDYLGYMKPLDFYSQINVVIITSVWYDPLPRIIYESISFNVIPILSIHSGGKTIVQSIDKNLIFDPNNRGDFERVISYLKTTSNLKSIYKSLKRIGEGKQFTIEKTSYEYMEFYKKIIND
ncbi:MAG: glycosyltransferase [Balneola sp.]|nr:MAG: glycosyltransferase [Balneola sp.]